MTQIEQAANEHRQALTSLFNEVRQKIIEREETLKLRVSMMVETEQTLQQQRIRNLEDQIRCIVEMQNELGKMNIENNLSILQKSKVRLELSAEANKRVENYKLKNVLPEVCRDDEIAFIVKMIVPSQLRPTLLSSTMASQIRKQKTIEGNKKRELQQNLKEVQMMTSTGFGGNEMVSPAERQQNIHAITGKIKQMSKNQGSTSREKRHENSALDQLAKKKGSGDVHE